MPAPVRGVASAAYEIAAIGVVLYLIGAVVTHLRAKDYEIAPPVVLALLAVAAYCAKARRTTPRGRP